MTYKDLLKFLKNKSVLLTSHSPVDLDGFVSCLIFHLFLKEFNQNTVVNIYFSEISKSTKLYMEKFLTLFSDLKFPLQSEFNSSDFDIILILDTNNLELIGNIADSSTEIPFIFIDHHLNLEKQYKNNLMSYNIINEEYTSTTEIVYNIINTFNFSLPIPYKYLIASAIVTDSYFLKYANNKTFLHLSKLLQEQVNYQEVIELLNIPLDLSEKIAKIKGLQRVNLIKVNNWLIGVSHVGSFSATVASMLINIGFDISIVYSKQKLGYRITMRASKSVCLETGLHLGRMLSELGNKNGGGHESAASFSTNSNNLKFIDNILDNLKKILIKEQSL